MSPASLGRFHGKDAFFQDFIRQRGIQGALALTQATNRLLFVRPFEPPENGDSIRNFIFLEENKW